MSKLGCSFSDDTLSNSSNSYKYITSCVRTHFNSNFYKTLSNNSYDFRWFAVEQLLFKNDLCGPQRYFASSVVTLFLKDLLFHHQRNNYDPFLVEDNVHSKLLGAITDQKQIEKGGHPTNFDVSFSADTLLSNRFIQIVTTAAISSK